MQTLSSTLRVRRWAFGVCLHFVGSFDPEKIESALEHAPGEIAQREARATCRLGRFQNRAGLVESVEAVGQLEEIVRQDVRAKIVQYLRNDFGELAKALGQIDLRRFS